jgi:hypothetical protein
MFDRKTYLFVVLIVLQGLSSISSFSPRIKTFVCRGKGIVERSTQLTAELERKDGSDQAMFEGVIELANSSSIESTAKAAAATSETNVNGGVVLAPFLSQGEIDPEAMNPDLSDPKQARVIVYIILSLVPVLFLIPLMIGSRDLIPLDAVPPVQM